MIELEILNSPDSEIKGEYLTYKNDLIIGSSCEADLPIQDSSLNDIHCIFRLLPTHIYIRTVPSAAYFLLNGKKFAGEKNLKLGDKVVVGETEIKLSSFVYDPSSSPGDFKDYYKKTIATYPETAILLEVLEREIAGISNSTQTMRIE